MANKYEKENNVLNLCNVCVKSVPFVMLSDHSLGVGASCDGDFSSNQGPRREGSIVCCVPDAINIWFSLSHILKRIRMSKNVDGSKRVLTSHLPEFISSPDDSEVLTMRNFVPLDEMGKIGEQIRDLFQLDIH